MSGSSTLRLPPLRRLIPPIVLIGLLLLVFASGLNDYLSLEMLRQNRTVLLDLVARHPFAAPVLITGVYATVVALSIPGAVWLTLAAGFLFGTLGGGLLAVVGASVGATVIFLVARTAAGDILRRRAGPWVARMADGFARNAFSYMLLLRLVPLFPFWLVNIVPALLGVRLSSYVAATLIGILPATFVYAGIGSGLGEVFARGETPDLAILLQLRFLLPLAGLLLLSLMPVAYKRLRGRGGDAAGAQPPIGP
jgi:uncharacterized membrane protein YdjX (TVP38/TMEM64 family)